MKTKKLIKALYYTASTLLVVGLGITVAHNFVRDGRPFEKPAVAVAKDKSVKPIPAVDKNSEATVKVNKSKSKDSTEEKQVNYRVEVVNCTGKEQVGQDVKSTLEANGFTVVLKYSGTIRGDTVITVRSEKKAGKKVQRLLKAGRINEDIQKEPYFDAIIEIGIDFAP